MAKKKRMLKKKRRLTPKRATRDTMAIGGLRFEVEFAHRPPDNPLGTLYGPDGKPWLHIALKDVIDGRPILTGGNNNAFIKAMGDAMK